MACLIFIMNSHEMNASSNQPIRTNRIELASTWLARTHSNQMAAPNIIKPNNCLRDSIHFPGFGRRFTSDGKSAIKKYGNAKPKAKKKKIR